MVEAWLPALCATKIIVVSDAAASDDMQKALMQMATPDSVELQIVSIAESKQVLQEAEKSPEKVLVLAPGPSEVRAMVEAGLRCSAVNVGGLHHAVGRVQLGKAIFINNEDAAALRAIHEHGIRLEGRAVPSEAPSDIAELIRTVRS